MAFSCSFVPPCIISWRVCGDAIDDRNHYSSSMVRSDQHYQVIPQPNELLSWDFWSGGRLFSGAYITSVSQGGGPCKNVTNVHFMVVLATSTRRLQRAARYRAAAWYYWGLKERNRQCCEWWCTTGSTTKFMNLYASVRTIQWQYRSVSRGTHSSRGCWMLRSCENLWMQTAGLSVMCFNTRVCDGVKWTVRPFKLSVFWTTSSWTSKLVTVATAWRWLVLTGQ